MHFCQFLFELPFGNFLQGTARNTCPTSFGCCACGRRGHSNACYYCDAAGCGKGQGSAKDSSALQGSSHTMDLRTRILWTPPPPPERISRTLLVYKKALPLLRWCLQIQSNPHPMNLHMGLNTCGFQSQISPDKNSSNIQKTNFLYSCIYGELLSGAQIQFMFEIPSPPNPVRSKDTTCGD